MQKSLFPPIPDKSSPFDRDFLLRPREPGISRLDKIPIRECGEPLVLLKGLSPRLRVKAPLPWARAAVARRLVEVAESLPERLLLLVHTSLRSHTMQEKAYWNYFKMMGERHPNWPPSVLRREVNRFLHPPDYKAPPGHCTGGAVDVGIIYSNGRRIDMMSSEPPEQKTWGTFYRQLTPPARANRALLYNAMIKAGFTNCYDEWWHYSYGDSAWAVRSGNESAIYGLPPEIPPELGQLIQRVQKKIPRRPRI